MMAIVLKYTSTGNYWSLGLNGEPQWLGHTDHAVRYKSMGGALRALRAHKSLRYLEHKINRIELKARSAQPLL